METGRRSTDRPQSVRGARPRTPLSTRKRRCRRCGPHHCLTRRFRHGRCPNEGRRSESGNRGRRGRHLRLRAARRARRGQHRGRPRTEAGRRSNPSKGPVTVLPALCGGGNGWLEDQRQVGGLCRNRFEHRHRAPGGHQRRGVAPQWTDQRSVARTVGAVGVDRKAADLGDVTPACTVVHDRLADRVPRDLEPTFELGRVDDQEGVGDQQGSGAYSALAEPPLQEAGGGRGSREAYLCDRATRTWGAVCRLGYGESANLHKHPYRVRRAESVSPLTGQAVAV